MTITLTPWRPLTAHEIDQAPREPGIFQIGTLVRTVIFIGDASDSVASALEYHLSSDLAHSKIGKLYFRYHLTDRTEQAQRRLLDEYKRAHGGALPPAQKDPAKPRQQRHLKAV